MSTAAGQLATGIEVAEKPVQGKKSHHMGRGQVVVSHQALTANSHPTAKALPRRKDGTLTSLNTLLGSMSWTHALSDVD